MSMTVKEFSELSLRERQDELDQYLRQSSEFKNSWDFLYGMTTSRSDSLIDQKIVLAKAKSVLRVNEEDNVDKVFEYIVKGINESDIDTAIYFLDVSFVAFKGGGHDPSLMSMVRYDYQRGIKED